MPLIGCVPQSALPALPALPPLFALFALLATRAGLFALSATRGFRTLRTGAGLFALSTDRTLVRGLVEAGLFALLALWVVRFRRTAAGLSAAAFFFGGAAAGLSAADRAGESADSGESSKAATRPKGSFVSATGSTLAGSLRLIDGTAPATAMLPAPSPETAATAPTMAHLRVDGMALPFVDVTVDGAAGGGLGAGAIGAVHPALDEHQAIPGGLPPAGFLDPVRAGGQ